MYIYIYVYVFRCSLLNPSKFRVQGLRCMVRVSPLGFLCLRSSVLRLRLAAWNVVLVCDWALGFSVCRLGVWELLNSEPWGCASGFHSLGVGGRRLADRTVFFFLFRKRFLSLVIQQLEAIRI